MSGEGVGRAASRVAPRTSALIVVVLLAVSYAIGSTLGWGGEAFTGWAEALAAGGAALSLLYAVRRSDAAVAETAAIARPGLSRPPRDAWLWFGIAAACWFAGAAIKTIFTTVLSRATVSVADLFLLAGLVALGTGFVVSVRLPRDGRIWLRYLADTYVCVCALLVLGWVAQFSRLYRLSGGSAYDFLLELMFPLIGAVLVCLVPPFVLGAARGQRRALAWAYLVLLALVAADVLSAVVRLRGGAVAEDPGDILRVAGFLLLGLVPWLEPAVRPVPGRVPAERDDADVHGHMIVPGVRLAAIAGAATLFVAGHALTGSAGLEPVISLIAVSATLVLLVRLAGLLRENEALRQAVGSGEEHFHVLAASISEAVLICDRDAIIEYVSTGARLTYRYPPGELLGRSLHEYVHPEDLPGVREEFLRFVSGTGDELQVACRVRAVDGTWLPTESTVSRYSGTGDGRSERLLVTVRDLSETAALQRQVTHLTFHDGLTGLPNRAFFEERTREVLAGHRDGGQVAVIFADLDGFTAVNDSAGHAAGDQVLAQAARRLRGALQPVDTVARWGGDEFAVLVENPAEAQSVVELAERLLRALAEQPYLVSGRGIALTASVGIAFADDDLADGAELIRNGDLAMARAKELGGGRVEVFAAHMHADVVRRLELGGELQRALADEQFTVEFQPVVELATSRVMGVEALVRWWRGNDAVPPEEFIAPAEESGLMIPLGEWVLREACRQVAGWRAGSWEIGLSVNFTARQIAAPRFVEMVAGVLAETGLPPQALTVEVREEVLVEDAGQNVARLSQLRDLGVRLAIDDFGTGYASLVYLGQLPVDIIKIDPSFVAGLGRDDTLTLLTRTIVRLGRDLGLTVVAEGIERPEQLELLRAMDCPRGQGFLVARPMAAGRIESLVRTGTGGADVQVGDPVLPTGSLPI